MNPSNTYALVIGINQYQCPDYSTLEAAVNDANAVDSYLKTTLKVPKEHIINIRNAEASREGILNSFQGLEKITERAQQPCIIIFYAGHGARTERPPQWLDWATDSEFVEMLCPCDIGVELEDEEGVVEGIPDRTVCYLLNQLSTLRGNNITLILDCCCSAGLNRGTTTYTPRSILNPPRLSGKADPRVVVTENMAKQDETTTTTRGMRPSAGFGGKFQDSHVLLAACGRERFAFENEGRGLFTTALLSTFASINLGTTTYTSLMDRLKMPKWQTPHCEGSHMDRPLFDRGGIRSDPSLIPGKRYKNENNELVVSLDAGMAQGITLGELFTTHESNLLDTGSNINPSIGTLGAITVDSFSTSLGHPAGHKKFKIPRFFYARRTDWRNDPPKVYCQDRAWLQSVFPPNSSMQQIDVVSSPADAALILELEGVWVHIQRNDPLLNQYLPQRFPHRLRRDSPGDVQSIIKAWQHFNYHLYRRGKNEFAQVRMELHYLEQIDPGDDESSCEPENYRPMGENLLASEPSEVLVPDADVDKPVGMTLFNDSDIPIYPYLFYFDPNELTITPWFTAPHGAGSGEVDAPLLPHSRFAVGYANGAASPWQFCFDQDDRDKDIGFFRLFLSGSPANFTCIAQDESPFKRLGTTTRGSGGPENDLGEAQQLEKLDKYSWGVKAATIIQIRE